MCEQDEIWQESRYFSEVRINELCDDGRTRGIDGPVEWARLEAEARKMLESGLELADRVEAAWDINRIPGRRADSLWIGLYTNFLDTTTQNPYFKSLHVRKHIVNDGSEFGVFLGTLELNAAPC